MEIVTAAGGDAVAAQPAQVTLNNEQTGRPLVSEAREGYTLHTFRFKYAEQGKGARSMATTGLNKVLIRIDGRVVQAIPLVIPQYASGVGYGAVRDLYSKEIEYHG
jgi:hypothetical protein